MILQEDKLIRLGGVTLPGLTKKLEITTSARIDEAEVEGSPIKPKQAVGYEDAKIIVELIIDDTSGERAIRKLERIQQLYRSGGAKKPSPVAIVCKEASAAGVDKVLIKDCKITKNNKSGQYAVTLELWEYIPFVISTASSSAAAQAPQTSGLTDSYQEYLSGSRGSAPTGKLAQTPAADFQFSNDTVRLFLDRF